MYSVSVKKTHHLVFLKFTMPWRSNSLHFQSDSKVKTSCHCRGGSIAASTAMTWVVGLQLIQVFYAFFRVLSFGTFFFRGICGKVWRMARIFIPSCNIWGFPKIGVPQNGWFIMEHPIKMDDLVVPLFSETSIYRNWTMMFSPKQNLSHFGKQHFQGNDPSDPSDLRYFQQSL